MHIIRPLVLSAFVICATTSCCGHLGGDRLSDRSNLTEYVGATVKAHGGDAIATYDAILAEHHPGPQIRRDIIRYLADKHSLVGLRTSAKPTGKNEDALIGADRGLQTRNIGRFRNVVQGSHPERESKYLWTIDDRGINIALENTPFPTRRGVIVHTNISSQAFIGGEAWFDGNAVTIDAGSGRFGDRSGLPARVWQGAIRYWQHLGYEVEAIPFGQR